MPVSPIEWVGGVEGHLRLLDQTRLPCETVWIECRTVESVWEAIRLLRVRGAPAIGVAAAFGAVLGIQPGTGTTRAALAGELRRACEYLGTSRPTAVNLFWALERLQRTLAESPPDRGRAWLRERLLTEAQAIYAEDRATCLRIGEAGAELLKDGQGVLTHCNAGTLATAQYGTALSVIYQAHREGKRLQVFADETRPLLQGARLTCWELMQEGVDVTLICDSMAGQVLREGRVQTVIVGADRIAANGDTANKIGTYGLAVLAHAHGIPFYVAAPRSTFDLSLPSGESIPIELRPGQEITDGFGRRTAPAGVQTYNPAFDVTPARLIQAFITDRGVIQPPFENQLRQRMGG